MLIITKKLHVTNFVINFFVVIIILFIFATLIDIVAILTTEMAILCTLACGRDCIMEEHYTQQNINNIIYPLIQTPHIWALPSTGHPRKAPIGDLNSHTTLILKLEVLFLAPVVDKAQSSRKKPVGLKKANEMQ